jgi:hypothetical protein
MGFLRALSKDKVLYRVWNLGPQCDVRWPCQTFQSIRSCVSA